MKSKSCFTIFVKPILLLFLLVHNAALLKAANISVCPSGCDHTSIKAAVSAAVSGDTISIQNGTYTESNIGVSKDLTILGEGQTTTIIQGAADVDSAVDGIFRIWGENTIIFKDFTIRHGYAKSGGASGGVYGGGIQITLSANSLMLLERVTISDNKAHQSGGGLSLNQTGGTVVLEDCIIHNNEANLSLSYANGGGLYNEGSNLIMLRTVVSANKAGSRGGGVYIYAQNSNNQFINCTIYENIAGYGTHWAEGGGFYLYATSTELLNCTVVNNSLTNAQTQQNGAGVFWRIGDLKISNSIIANNVTDSGNNNGQNLYNGSSSTLSINTSLIEDCFNCSITPTYTTDPNLAAVAFCDGKAYFAPQAPSDALNNGTAPIGNLPTLDICRNNRVANYDLGSYNVQGIAGNEIKIKGNNQYVINGATLTNKSNNTNFGGASSSNPKINTFQIENDGKSSLALTNYPNAISISESAAFTIHQQPISGTVDINTPANFEISFAPSTLGFYEATISIANSITDKNPYTFKVSGFTCPSGTEIYVDATATGNNNGSSWSNAFTDLQDGIDVACDCGIADVWVAKGTYYPSKDKNKNFVGDLSLENTFSIDCGINIYGGFPNGGATFENRDNNTNPVILSGDLDKDGMSSNNAYTVIFIHPFDGSLSLDGLVIKDGNSNGTANEVRAGGAIYADLGYNT